MKTKNPEYLPLFFYLSMIFQNILQTIGKTPIVRINALAPQGINMYVKVESFNPMSSVKVFIHWRKSWETLQLTNASNARIV